MPASNESKPHEVRWDKMSHEALERVLAACPAVFFPYGVTGPNHPDRSPGLDIHQLLIRTAQQFGGIVAPPEPWQTHETARKPATEPDERVTNRPWQLALPLWLHLRNICHHVQTAEALGFHAAILVSSHRAPHQDNLRSLVRHLQPSVRLRLFGVAIELDSRIDDLMADPRLGEALADELVHWLGRHQIRLLRDFDPERETEFETFDDVETVWSQTLRQELARDTEQSAFWTDPATLRPLGDRSRQYGRASNDSAAGPLPSTNIQVIDAWLARVARHNER